MVQKRIRRTDQEWLDLIRECRTSGLTDKAWYEQQHIQRMSSDELFDAAFVGLFGSDFTG